MTTIGRPMVLMPIVAKCPDGKWGGFNFGSGTMGAGGTPAAGGMSHGGGMSHSGAPTSPTKRQSPLAGISVFLGQGDDGTAMTYMQKGQKVKAGYYISKSASTNLMTEVINYRNAEQEIFVSLDYEYIPNMPTRPKEYLDVGMGAINVEPCGSQNLKPPLDKAMKYVSQAWDVQGDGFLLDIKPHLHDGGLDMTFFVNGVQKCTSKAVYGVSGAADLNGQKWETIGAYTPCLEPIEIKKGDKLTMEANYDLTKHRLRPQSTDHNEGAEAMAMAIFSFARPPY
ncbi:hypothetical protein EJ08DRAFT_663670 [Tothia fuscella]|uniref:Uncharacterized protein n=1 Tax=Tothia fuscella TaxID=1048955 RepID=A0A9P4TVX3_9PEZI|nr:hypothetical protein EJ08DRAFT_663670 [Tothia fuscella]